MIGVSVIGHKPLIYRLSQTNADLPEVAKRSVLHRLCSAEVTLHLHVASANPKPPQNPRPDLAAFAIRGNRT